MPRVEDMMHERVRINAHLFQIGTVTKADPQFGARTAGFRPVEPSRPLGRWNAAPTYSDREAEAQRESNRANATQVREATQALRPILELKQTFGDDLGSLTAEDVQQQLRARRVPADQLKGPKGGPKQARTLRKMLLELGDAF
eukprot:CAMPEP_0183372346 /NCGR_PEP_ID=MMETSP0164_2-20130417/108214_1 /TAXON_ID=221442 /ORGANISM="Coccolithus pelagicus ssp braarudi, Strain PLY182g" /LENGTH=142 /DNA_ID=CAMNT_0025549033 /DNA_START=22 /DNA_END=447 /DNA_ORIENTATION=-